MSTEPPNSAWTELETLYVWKTEITSKVKMCEEVGLGNPTVLEADHASAQGSLVIVSFKGSTGVKRSFLFPLPSSPCQYH